MKINLLLTFYRNFIVLSLTISLICAFVFLNAGYPLLAMSAWFKVIMSGIIFFYINRSKKKEFLYYYNLGLSKQFLWCWTLGIDLLFYILMLFLTNIL